MIALDLAQSLYHFRVWYLGSHETPEGVRCDATNRHECFIFTPFYLRILMAAGFVYFLFFLPGTAAIRDILDRAQRAPDFKAKFF